MTMLPTAADLPESLHQYDQWICWREQTRGSKPTKVPVDPQTGQYASATDAETWTSLNEARAYADGESVDGLGFVFTDADPFVGVDLDDARDPEAETPTEWAEEIIEDLDSYTEVSPSGTGYHVLVEGELPPGRNRRGNVELYETSRFFTVSGVHVAGSPTTIETRSDALRGVYADHVADEAEAGEQTTLESDETSTKTASNPSLSDEDLLERARSASNSDKFERLWRGDTRGYDSQSEADMALACLLAFWTGGDTGQMDRLFRQSGLLREKWDTPHYADGSTYGEKTLARAASVTSDHYSPTATTEDRKATEPKERPSASNSSEEPATTTSQTIPQQQDQTLETVATLEQEVRDLRAENTRLRTQYKTAQERIADLENEATETESSTTSQGLMNHLRQLFP